MRVLLIVAWLFAGLGGLIFHYGPGQEKLEIDRVGATLHQARQQVANQDWLGAITTFDAVLADLPKERMTESHVVALEKAKAQMMAAQLPMARQSLEGLLEDLRSDANADPGLVSDVQSTLANSQYYMTWLMRLEGLPEEEWMPEIEAARQHYTELAGRAEASGDSEMANSRREDLESAIRLARMDLGELQGLPLPSQ